MKAAAIHNRLMIFLLAALAITCVISPWMSLGADWFASQWPQLLTERVPFEKIFNRGFMSLSAGIFAGFLEEVFFRGILFAGLRKHGGPLRAYVLANLFYSVIHFVKPGEDYFIDRLDLLAGFRHLGTTFEPFLDPLSLVPGIIGLFLLGAVMSYALARTGNLYLSIGLHAGWIFSLKMVRVFGNFTRQDLGWMFGSTDPKIVSGVATWVGILLVGLAVSRLTRLYARISSYRPQSTTA